MTFAEATSLSCANDLTSNKGGDARNNMVSTTNVEKNHKMEKIITRNGGKSRSRAARKTTNETNANKCDTVKSQDMSIDTSGENTVTINIEEHDRIVARLTQERNQLREKNEALK